MKKLFNTLAIAGLALSVAACGQQAQEPAEEKAAPESKEAKAGSGGPGGKPAMPPAYLPPTYIPFGEEASFERILETYGYSARKPAASVLERGEQVYTQWCLICHGTGTGMAGTESLMRKYRGELPALLTERDDLDADLIEYYVRNGIASMPWFRKTEVSDEDLAALSIFLTTKEATE